MKSNLTKKRHCSKEKDVEKVAKPTKTIYIPIDKNEYLKIQEHEVFRKKLDLYIKKFPEIFPEDITGGYVFHDVRKSEKMSLQLRRIKLKKNKKVYMIAPSFVMPYMTGDTTEIETPLFLRKFGVPYWALSYIYGKNDMYWYRLENRIGRNSLVGTTIRKKNCLPQHLMADEKFSRENKKRIYIAMTSADDCILGASITNKVDQVSLEQSYGFYQKEAKNVCNDYKPITVTTDGWNPTRWAWMVIYPEITLILCFLHSFLKIRDACKLLENYNYIASAVWEAYKKTIVHDFQQAITNLYTWAKCSLESKKAIVSIHKLYDKMVTLSVPFSFRNCYRTTANLDRLMDHIDRLLYASKYFHGHKISSERSIRAWSLLYNFSPYSSRYNKPYLSPAHKINGFVYHHSWLQNLLVSSSMGGFRE